MVLLCETDVDSLEVQLSGVGVPSLQAANLIQLGQETGSKKSSIPQGAAQMLEIAIQDLF